MRSLFDTHSFLWYIRNDSRVRKSWIDIVGNPENEILLSVASLWEIAIKSALGKLSIESSITRLIEERVMTKGIKILPITSFHLDQIQRLPHHHGDPFDRLLIAQAIVEDIPIMSTDAHFNPYDIQIIR